jgi:hypothetical protein
VRVLPLHDRVCQEVPHFPEEGEVVGHVVSDTPTTAVPTHPYLVMLDRPLTCSIRGGSYFQLTARHYAEDEITPI